MRQPAPPRGRRVQSRREFDPARSGRTLGPQLIRQRKPASASEVFQCGDTGIPASCPAMPSRKPGPIDYNALPELLRPLAERGEVRRYRKGALVLDEGDRGDQLYIVLTGELRAFTGSDSGRHITYALYGPGDYLGRMGPGGGPGQA